MLTKKSAPFETSNYSAQETFSLSFNYFHRKLSVTTLGVSDLETMLSDLGFQLEAAESTYLLGPFSKESNSFLNPPIVCDQSDDSKKISGYRICASSNAHVVSLNLSISTYMNLSSHGLMGVVKVVGSDSEYLYQKEAQSIARKVEAAYKLK